MLEETIMAQAMGVVHRDILGFMETRHIHNVINSTILIDVYTTASLLTETIKLVKKRAVRIQIKKINLGFIFLLFVQFLLFRHTKLPMRAMIIKSVRYTVGVR